MNISTSELKRAGTCSVCRVSQAVEPRVSAAAAAADSDGKCRMYLE